MIPLLGIWVMPVHWIKACCIWAKKKTFLSLNFCSLFFQISSPFYNRNWFPEKKNFKFHLQVGFLGPPGEPIKLPSLLIGILSEFSSSWKVPNVGSRLWLLQGHNLSTIVYYTMKTAKLSNTIWLHKCFIQCRVKLEQKETEQKLLFPKFVHHDCKTSWKA